MRREGGAEDGVEEEGDAQAGTDQHVRVGGKSLVELPGDDDGKDADPKGGVGQDEAFVGACCVGEEKRGRREGGREERMSGASCARTHNTMVCIKALCLL